MSCNTNENKTTGRVKMYGKPKVYKPNFGSLTFLVMLHLN